MLMVAILDSTCLMSCPFQPILDYVNNQLKAIAFAKACMAKGHTYGKLQMDTEKIFLLQASWGTSSI